MIHIYSGITCIRVLNGELNAQNMQYSTHLACGCKTCNILRTMHVDAKHAMYYPHAILMQNMHYITHLAC